jgi:hypothetical protein
MDLQYEPVIQRAVALINDSHYAQELEQFLKACFLGRADDILMAQYAIRVKLAEIAPDDPATRDAHFCRCLMTKSDLRHVPFTPANDHEVLAEAGLCMDILIFGHFDRLMAERDIGIFTLGQLNETSAWVINNFVDGFGAFDEIVTDTAAPNEIDIHFIKVMMLLARNLIDSLDQTTSQAQAIG